MRKAPEASDKQGLCDGVGAKASQGDNLSAEENLYDVCLQTGEEFSTEFLRDRMGLRRVNVIPSADTQQPRSAGFISAKNFDNPFYEDVASVPHHRRVYSNCSPDVLERSVVAASDVTSLDAVGRAHNFDEISRFHGGRFDYFSQGLGVPYDNGNVRVAVGLSSESPQSHNAHGLAISEALLPKKMKFLCSYGGKILPRPNDAKLRYVGGETRIISIRENITWQELVKKTSVICHQSHTIKYQLPGEDLDALISVSTDEDLHHMIEEYQELEKVGGSQKLRLFLVPTNETDSPTPRSLESRAVEQSDVDFQYVTAVNGITDRSPNKQAVANQSSQVGTLSSYNPSFPEDSQTHGQALEAKELSPNYSKLVEMNFNPSTLFCNNAQVIGNVLNLSPHNNVIVGGPVLDDQACIAASEGTIPTSMDRIMQGKNINIVPQDSSMLFHLDALKNLLAEAELVNGESVSQLHVQNPHKDLPHAFHYTESDGRSGNLCFSYDDKIDLPLKGSNELSDNTTNNEQPTEVEKYSPLLEVGSFPSREWQMKSQDLCAVAEAQDQNRATATALCDDNTVNLGNKIVLNFSEMSNAEADMINAVLVVEDVTNNLTSADIPKRSRTVIPCIEDEFSDEESLPRELEAESTNQDIDSEVT